MISIKRIKQIREELQLTHLVLFGIDANGVQHIATYGKTKINAEQAAEAGNNLKKSLKWPEDMCNSKPLDRICYNCSFWKMKKTDPGYPIPEFFPGKCFHDPSPIVRNENDIACFHFEPNR